MEYMNRNSWAGFLNYWYQRPEHFEDLFGVKLDDESAIDAYIECRELRRMLSIIDFKNIVSEEVEEYD
jgi:hypothetical protein